MGKLTPLLLCCLNLLLVLLVLPRQGCEAAAFESLGKLAISGYNGNASLGTSVDISEDGLYGIVGGPGDNAATGAAWIFVRSGLVWEQQSKLVAAGSTAATLHGFSVAINRDGSYAVVGGPGATSSAGAAWIYTRIGSNWSQQAKLLPEDPTGAGSFGWSVDINFDGTFVIVGALRDNSDFGAAWIFQRFASSWVQQTKLIGAEAIGNPAFGSSVAFNVDASYAVIGGPDDNNLGAVWVFQRTDSTWSQKEKLVAVDYIGTPRLGESVDINAEGTFVIASARQDDSFIGAAFIFVRAGTSWSQQSKLKGSGYIQSPPPSNLVNQGASVSIDAKGLRVLVGGKGDNADVGAVWSFIRTVTGSAWKQEGEKVVGANYSTTVSPNLIPPRASVLQGSSVAMSGDGLYGFVGGPDDDIQTGAVWAIAEKIPPGLSLEAQIGVGVGVSIGIVLLSASLVVLRKRRRNKTTSNSGSAYFEGKASDSQIQSSDSRLVQPSMAKLLPGSFGSSTRLGLKFFIFISYVKRDTVAETMLVFQNAKTEFPTENIFRDSDEHFLLSELVRNTQLSQNMLVFLSYNYLRSPYCLVELCAAIQVKVNIISVLVHRTGLAAFVFEEYHQLLKDGTTSTLLDDKGWQVLEMQGYKLQQVESAIRLVLDMKAFDLHLNAAHNVVTLEIKNIFERLAVESSAAV